MSLPSESFRQLQSEAPELDRRQEYARARALLEEDLPFFCAHLPGLILWRAYLTIRQGKLEEALAILEEAVAQELWFGPAQLEDESLNPLRSLPAFATATQSCQERYAEAQSRSHPGILVPEPDNPVPLPDPTLFVLHGNQSSPLAELEYWQPMTAHGWQVVLPYSSQPVAYGLAGWNEEACALEEVCIHWEQQQCRKRIAPGLAQEGGIPAIGFIAICPALEANQVFLPHDACRVRLGLFLPGEHDEGTPATLATTEGLRASGLSCEVPQDPGLSHDFPPGFAEELPAS
jgi:hypothetical protein